MNRRLRGALFGALAMLMGGGALLTATGTASAQTAHHHDAPRGAAVTLTARSTSITDSSPFSQVSVDTACPTDYQDNLNVYVVAPDGRESTVASRVTDGAPFSSRPVTATIPAATTGQTVVRSLKTALALVGQPIHDGVYPIHVVCGNADPAAFLEHPASTGFIEVTGDTFQVKNLAAPVVTSLKLSASPAGHALVGQPITLTAKVTPNVPGVVKFTTNGTTPVGSPVPVVDGQAGVVAPSVTTPTVRTYVATFVPTDQVGYAQDVTVFRYSVTNAPAIQVTDAAGNALTGTPRLTPGQHITISAQGFLPESQEKVLPFVSNALALYAPVATDDQGSLTGYDLTVPVLSGRGSHTLTLTGLRSFVQVSFTFTTK
ncbi:hypothetical protein [Actinacidiphila epipremni]|uniref:Ig-like domain repeat protein n=1 Tax=Actinacidiphila epipremni TaxID=2053013 RepID=A0ABX0ZM07_9ACTN|nr:hypothetical protein [Actinacidiphila epipremni]NJP42688.1 hypothetical protein [Actinacidiphila epipremni]